MERRYYPPVTMHVEPHAIPAALAVLDASLTEHSDLLYRLGNFGYIREPWLGDPASARLTKAYNDRVMDADDGPYAALRAYEKELIKIRNALTLMQDSYVRTDNAAAESLRPL